MVEFIEVLGLDHIWAHRGAPRPRACSATWLIVPVLNSD